MRTITQTTDKVLIKFKELALIQTKMQLSFSSRLQILGLQPVAEDAEVSTLVNKMEHFKMEKKRRL